MKLIPKAKPVKIRIKSGGEEHSTLDSLKHNFCVEDIRLLIDGRLSRWLRQQNENELAEAITDIDLQQLDSLEGMLSFIKLFFPISQTSLIDLAKYWNTIHAYKKNSEYLYNYLLDKNIEAAKHIYRSELLSSADWIGIFSHFEHQNDAEALYLLGELWLKGSAHNAPDKIKGIQYIEMAATLRYDDAIQFIINRKYEEQKTTERYANRFDGVDKEKISRWIKRNWEYGGVLIYKSYDYSNDKEKAILNFVCQCHHIKNMYSLKTFDTTLQKTLYYFKEQPNDFLENEKICIKACLLKIAGQVSLANQMFQDIEEGYSVARDIRNMTRNQMRFTHLLSNVVTQLFTC